MKHFSFYLMKIYYILAYVAFSYFVFMTAPLNVQIPVLLVFTTFILAFFMHKKWAYEITFFLASFMALLNLIAFIMSKTNAKLQEVFNMSINTFSISEGIYLLFILSYWLGKKELIARINEPRNQVIR